MEHVRSDGSATDAELDALFEQYFSVFPWERLGTDAVGFDLGCGSGRWARRVAPRVGTLHCIDASADALAVAQRNLAGALNCTFIQASVDELELPPASMDFGYSLGVLHHVPDTEAGLRVCARLLRPGAPLLVYLYYAFDNRPAWYRALWRASDVLRRRLSRAPHRAKLGVTSFVAVTCLPPARADGSARAPRRLASRCLSARLLRRPLALHDAHRRLRPFRDAAGAALYARRDRRHAARARFRGCPLLRRRALLVRRRDRARARDGRIPAGSRTLVLTWRLGSSSSSGC